MRDNDRAVVSARFFKTGKGQYGEGDQFLGITVPAVRNVVKKYSGKLSILDAQELLHSKWHEVRLAGCILLTELALMAEKLEMRGKVAVPSTEDLYEAYIANTAHINNWDLVDVSARDVVGNYLLARNWKIVLPALAKSRSLWERRIAIISTFAFIKAGKHEPTFHICDILMNDKEDLIHKACGWMLRELGKSCGQSVLDEFLLKRIEDMPRTTLRYAIERHGVRDREKFMSM